MVKTTRFAFLAGLVDGDGSITINKTACYQLSMCVYNTSRTLMNFLKAHFGGQYRKMTTVGNRKQKYCWTTTIDENIVGTALYLKLKKIQGKIAIKHIAMNSERDIEARHQLYLNIGEANQSYVPVSVLKSISTGPSTKEDSAYLAGILDSEGTFAIRSRKNRYVGNGMFSSSISISNTDQRMFFWISENVPGYMVTTDRSPNRMEGVWFISGKAREPILLSVIPYLIVKKERAIMVLEWIRNCRKMTFEQKHGIVEKMGVLNLRGISPETARQAQQCEDIVRS